MATDFDLAQTFYVDKDSVRQADTIFITSVDLFFKNKPIAGKTKTGIFEPGVSVYICPVDNDVPNLNAVYPEVARVEYAGIFETSTATTSTKFSFNFPIAIKTAQSYAILVKFDGSDDDFKLWWNKAGEKVLNTTNNTQVSSGKVDGFFYTITNGKMLTALKDADLKFALNVAKFTSNTATYKLNNSYNEFFKLFANSISGNFKGGEYVYQNTAPSTGTLTINATSKAIVGNGTSFTSTLQVGNKFVITDGTAGNVDVRTVTSIANNTYMLVDVVPSFSNGAGSYLKTPVGTVFAFNSMTERLTLENSTANTSAYFANNEYVRGVDSGASCRIEYIENFEANYIRPSFNITTPAGTFTNTAINIANSSYYQASGNKALVEINQIKFMDSYPAVIASRSYEVLNGATLFDGSKSLESEITFNTTNIYTSPYAKEENLDVFVTRYEINSDDTAEHTNSGNATSKYIAKRVVLADGQDAEDLRIYISAYKPANTDIRVYAKFHNNVDPEPFDDKDWTHLEMVTDKGLLSNPFNRNDVIEFEYKVPMYQDGTAANGLYTTSLGNNVIVGTGVTVNSAISVNDLVRIYQPTFPNNHVISLVTAVDSTSLTIADPIANSSMVSSGLQIDKINNKHTAFINIQNSNIIRYYNTTFGAYDGYKNFSIKIVLLSDNDYRVPHVNDLRAIAVSA
jgi:hypothetical protein